MWRVGDREKKNKEKREDGAEKVEEEGGEGRGGVWCNKREKGGGEISQKDLLFHNDQKGFTLLLI